MADFYPKIAFICKDRINATFGCVIIRAKNYVLGEHRDKPDFLSDRLLVSVILKRFRTDWQELLRTTPEVIRPPGLTAEREWYLYDQIRCHIPDENARDLTCPKPRWTKAMK